MRDNVIKISPFAYDAIIKLSIVKRLNCHAKAGIVIRIKDKKAEEYRKLLRSEEWLKVKILDEEERERLIFCGVVKNASIKRQGSDTILMLEAVSGTSLMDVKRHFRTFQDELENMLSICNGIADNYADAEISWYAGGIPAIGGCFIQYEETDWEFIKRLAEEFLSKNQMN